MSKSNDSDRDATEDRHPSTTRRIVKEPESRTAGVAVAHHPNPGPAGTEYTVEQLWPDGRAEPVYVGDEDDALHLIQALAEVVRR